jgi:hypothetical protein
VIEHEIAVDRLEAGLAKRGNESLELLDRYLRIAISLEHEIALEHAIDDRSVCVGLGAPAVTGTKQFERGKRRDQLHRRRGIHRTRRLQRIDRTRVTNLLDVRADSARWDVLVEKGAGNALRQRSACARRNKPARREQSSDGA